MYLYLLNINTQINTLSGGLKYFSGGQILIGVKIFIARGLKYFIRGQKYFIGGSNFNRGQKYFIEGANFQYQC